MFTELLSYLRSASEASSEFRMLGYDALNPSQVLKSIDEKFQGTECAPVVTALDPLLRLACFAPVGGFLCAASPDGVCPSPA